MGIVCDSSIVLGKADKENIVIPGDMEVVPIQERRQKGEKNFDQIYLDNHYKSYECVNDGYASVPQCLSVLVGCH